MSDNMPALVVPAYKVVSNTPGTVKNALGTYVPGHTITAQLVASMTAFSVSVPDDQMTLENVKSLLDEAAIRYAAVDGIGNT